MTERELETYYQVAAPFYDDDYADVWHGEDIEFYCGLATECGGPVLEMGCGTGRVLLPLARAGIGMHGVDCSPVMLARLRTSLSDEPKDVQERVALTCGDIRCLDVGARFPLVSAPGHVVQSFLERGDQRAWLRNVRRHLAPDGALCFDAFQPDYRRIIAPPEWVADVDRIDPVSGHRFRRFTRISHEPEFQRFRVEMRWLIEDNHGTEIEESSAVIRQRWFTRGELENLLELEGFRITHYWGSFKRTPFESGSPQQVIRAKVAG